MSVNWVYYSLVFNNHVTHPINLHNSILVCIFVILIRRIVFSSFHIFHFCPYLGRGFYFNLYLLYLKKLFMEIINNITCTFHKYSD